MNEHKTTIYFAHSTSMMNTKKEQEIIEVLEKRGYMVINPFEKEDEICQKYGVKNYYEAPTKKFAEEIETKDWELVDKSAEYFGWFECDFGIKTLIGTSIEMDRSYLMGKKITVIINILHPFVWNRANIIYLSYDDFIRDIRYWDV